jgi:hypothetical protein
MTRFEELQARITTALDTLATCGEDDLPGVTEWLPRVRRDVLVLVELIRDPAPTRAPSWQGDSLMLETLENVTKQLEERIPAKGCSD